MAIGLVLTVKSGQFQRWSEQYVWLAMGLHGLLTGARWSDLSSLIPCLQAS